MSTKLKLLFYTVIHLKWIQIYYQVYYKLRSRLLKPSFFGTHKGYKSVKASLNLAEEPFFGDSSSVVLEVDATSFTFLNISKEFPQLNIDWNFEGNGKLWNYNLNYFDFLFAPNLNSSQGKALIDSFVDSCEVLQGGLEPYPISLRGINWIKYLSVKDIRDEHVDKSLYKQYKVLFSQLEYHILANHLLENAFSIFFGAYYFQNDAWYMRASQLLKKELKEQVLPDGAHYERSPMYHQIILFRLLDAINLVRNNSWKQNDLLDFLVNYAEKMLCWLDNISFSNGEIPFVKDSAAGIAPSNEFLKRYAERLEIEWNADSLSMKDSNYRKMKTGSLECLVDIGSIAPSYQPGHAHADELNFLLCEDGKPILVDTGISTYEKNERRQLERSTISHNCISINGLNSSKVWGGFRVAKRAGVTLLKDSVTEITAEHNGFSTQGVLVSRTFKTDGSSVSIYDKLKTSKEKFGEAFSYLHLHPDVNIKLLKNELFVNNLRMIFTGFTEITTENYMFACGFNQLREAKRIKLKMSKETRINIEYAN